MTRSTIRLEDEARTDDVVILRASLPVSRDGAGATLRYETRTGALLRVDGAVRGAFDRQHHAVFVSQAGEVTLEVERRSLPATGLPSGDGARWRTLLARAAQVPSRALGFVRGGRPRVATPRTTAGVSMVGHSHLDVAWLWTYEEAARKAIRTFATAVRQLEADPAFIFTQSQPQLYAFVAERDPAFFERIRALARAGRLDTSTAALWVEPDCNVPSGESLLRQMTGGIRYVERAFGTTPNVAWLPDSFGFANTLPTLFAHAGIAAFATTKLGWNDTTIFPHARFIWSGPDGSTVLAASIASIEGDVASRRVATARRRGDLLLVGHGDGGGGTTDAALARAARCGTWTSVADYFASFANGPALPRVCDELYLEAHRGVFTTHHDIKARNAALERALGEAELATAWARALHASPFFLTEARTQLGRAWEIVCRAQFHDVLPGTSVAAVYVDAHREYDEADALVENVHRNARSVLPVAARERLPDPVVPILERGTYVFENHAIFARIDRSGVLRELRVPGGANLVRGAHRLTLYRDRPKRWDAWNVDRGYRRRKRRVRVTGGAIVDGGLEIRYAFGASLAVARFTLDSGEPFLRVDYAVDWRERHALLRVENDLAFVASRAHFGSPHGTVERSADPRTAAERAKFEACGQRFARVDGPRGGLAVFALDTYGWSIDRGRRGTQLGHSLLRGPTWPDPSADGGEHAFSLAYVPFAATGMGELEALWKRFSGTNDVPMFTCDDPALFVVATMLADDADRIVVRVRECDGSARTAIIRCGARAREVESVDALERPIARDARIEDGAIVAAFAPYELRTFAVASRMIEAVLFDLDDTLHDDTLAYHTAARNVADDIAAERSANADALFAAYLAQAEAFWQTLSPVVFETPLAGLRARMWQAALLAVGIDDRELGERCGVAYNEYRRGLMILWPGALELLASLRARGCKLAMITNGMSETHRDKIALLKLEDAFDEIFIADEVGMVKPDVRLFRLAAERLGVAPERCAMVGDRYDRDIIGAHEAGMATVWMNVRDEHVPPGSPQPGVTVTSILEVGAALRALEPAGG